MAHSAQINVNGILTTVTEFDNPAQAIDDVVTVLGAPTTPQAALSALGAGVRPNLLDNAYFVGGGSQQGGGQMPINQTGATSWTGSVNYLALFDRWLGNCSGGGVTFSITSDGVVIPVTSSYVAISQRLLQPNSSMAGKTYTVSAIVGGELISATGEVTAVSSGDSTVFITSTGSNGCTVRLRYSPTNGMFFEVYTPNGGATVECCKLEEDEGQTLAYQDSTGAWHRLPQPEDGDYAGQLLKCQQYLIPLAANSAYGFASGDSVAYLYFPLPTSMRARPVFQGTAPSNLFPNDGHSVSGITVLSGSAIDNVVTLRVAGSGFTAYKSYELNVDAGFLAAPL